MNVLSKNRLVFKIHDRELLAAARRHPRNLTLIGPKNRVTSRRCVGERAVVEVIYEAILKEVAHATRPVTKR